MRCYGWFFLCLISPSLWAEDSGFEKSAEQRFYVGGGLGFTELDDDGMGQYQGFDDEAVSFRAFAGYEFNSYLAAEAAMDFLGYYDGGTVTSDIENSYSTLTLSLVGRIPLGGGLSMFAQAGGGIASVYQWVDGLIGPYYYDDDYEEDSGFANVWGAGFSYVLPMNEAIEIRAGYLETQFELEAVSVNQFGFLAKNEYDQTVEQFYLGAAYHF